MSEEINALTALEEENKELRKTIQKLQMPVITRERIVVPRDYELTKRYLKNATTRVKKLENIVNFGNISQVSDLIEEYTITSNRFMKKLLIEGQLLDFGRDEQNSIINLMDYIDNIKKELHSLILLHYEGKYVMQKELRECEFTMKKLMRQYQEQEISEDFKTEMLTELHAFLKNQLKVMKKQQKDMKKWTVSGKN